METFQPYLTYIGIGAGVLFGLFAIVWLTATFSFMRRTQGLNRFLVSFFKLLNDSQFKTAYGLTTPIFQAETNIKDFRKFIKRNKLTQYKRLSATVPELEGSDGYRLNLMVKLEGGKELPMKAFVIKEAPKVWRLEELDV